MAFGVMEILGIIGFIVGIIIAVRMKKLDVMALLTGWGIFVLFTPAWMVITDLIEVAAITNICSTYIDPIVTFFGLGIAIWVLIKTVLGMFK